MFPITITAKGPQGELICPSDEVIQLPPYESQLHMEFAHFQHFKKLTRQQLPHLTFCLIRNGGNPPDFVITREGTSLGLELTVFAFPERRERASFVARIHDRLIAKYDAGFLRGLTGVKIDLSFSELGYRPTPIDDASLEQLISQLDAITDAVRTPLPDDWAAGTEIHPVWASGQINNGAVKWNVSSRFDAPLRGSRFANHTGFEIEYTHREWLSRDEIQSVIEHCVAAKDKATLENDELLIVAGAPDKTGRIFPAEAVAASHLFKNWQGLTTKPNHLKRVFLDIWGAEKLYLLYERSEA